MPIWKAVRPNAVDEIVFVARLMQTLLAAEDGRTR
jgi:hypothetical protein